MVNFPSFDNAITGQPSEPIDSALAKANLQLAYQRPNNVSKKPVGQAIADATAELSLSPHATQRHTPESSAGVDGLSAQRKLGAILAAMPGTPTYGAGGMTGYDTGHQSIGAAMMGDSNRYTDNREARGWEGEQQGLNRTSREGMLDKQLKSQFDIEQLRAQQQAAALAVESQYRNKTADAAMLEAQARGGELQAKTDAIRKHTNQTPIQAFVNQYGGDILANDPSMVAAATRALKADLGHSEDFPMEGHLTLPDAIARANASLEFKGLSGAALLEKLRPILESLSATTSTASELREMSIRKGLTPEVLERASSYTPWNAYRRNDEPAEPFKDTGELIDDKMYGLPGWMIFGEGKEKFLERRKLQSNSESLRKAIMGER